MDSYGDMSKTMSGNAENSSESLSSVKNISFDGVWSGAAYDTLTSALENTIAKADIELANYESFSAAMEELESYKTKKERYDKLTELINGIHYPDSEKDPEGYASACATAAGYKAEQATLKDEMDKLRKSIESTLSAITANSSELTAVKFNYDDGEFNLDFDIADLYTMYNNGSLKIMNSGKSLYDYYDIYDDDGNLIRSGKEYVEGIITDIQSKYSGREAAVNCGLAMLQLAADVGIKINYEHAGTDSDVYVRTSDVASGVDCNPFVSWCLDKGVDDGFQWRPVSYFYDDGRFPDTIDYTNWSNAQAGDVLANGGHVMMIVENNTETGTFTVMHASGSNAGITVSERSYASLKSDGYKVKDMTNVYDGSYDTDRWEEFRIEPDSFVRDYV